MIKGNQILIIKVMDNTKEIVLNYKKYYSDGVPDKNKFMDIDTIFIIGEANNNGIPLLAVCDVSISNCTNIHQEFFSVSNGGERWDYEWDLDNVLLTNIDELRNYVNSEKAKEYITSIQKWGYLSLNDMNVSQLNNIVGRAILGRSKFSINTSNLKTIPKQSKKKPMECIYKLNDLVKFKNSNGLVHGSIEKIQERVENGVIYDQILTINNKKYSGNFITKNIIY